MLRFQHQVKSRLTASIKLLSTNSETLDFPHIISQYDCLFGLAFIYKTQPLTYDPMGPESKLLLGERANIHLSQNPHPQEI